MYVSGCTHVHVFFGGWCASQAPAAGWPRHRTCPPSHHPPGGNENADCWERSVCSEGSAVSDKELWSAGWTWRGGKQREERRKGVKGKKNDFCHDKHKSTQIDYKKDCNSCLTSLPRRSFLFSMTPQGAMPIVQIFFDDLEQCSLRASPTCFATPSGRMH